MHGKARILRSLFEDKPLLRIMGAHNGLGAKLIEKNRFDGIWASGLEISTAHAVPDANILTMTEHLTASGAINEATPLPVICDCDTGYGNVSNVRHMVKKYEAAGIAAVVIEDKLFPKVNSFIPGRQELAPLEQFAGKLEAAKAAQTDPDFMVFARIEALIAGWGMQEAQRRAAAYEEAGADALVIHSKSSRPDEIFEFAANWKGSLPLVVIPTTFYGVSADEWIRRGVRMVIYANHGLRASLSAMDRVFRSIYETGSSAGVEDKIASLKQVFEVQGMNGLEDEEKKYSKKETLQAVIPAAGDPRSQSDLEQVLNDRPLCMLEVGGKTLLDRQMELLRSCGAKEIFIIGGYGSERIDADGATVLHNADYAASGNAFSLMLAGERLSGKCVVVYSDIIFDRHILERLVSSPHPVTLVIDRAYQTLPYRNKKLDLVIAEGASGHGGERKLGLDIFRPVLKIGRRLDKKKANYEFIGMAFFRDRGIRELVSAWHEALAEFRGRSFYESPSVEAADLNDLIQYLIDRGCPVHGLEIEQGWSEIHSAGDYQRVNSHFGGRARTVRA